MTGLSVHERVVYEQLCHAAENNLPCPLNLDLEMLTGFNSGSMGPVLVARLETKGLIRVIRYQRFREVYIVAMDKWTARNPAQRTTAAHVPRGHAVLERAKICRMRKG